MKTFFHAASPVAGGGGRSVGVKLPGEPLGKSNASSLLLSAFRVTFGRSEALGRPSSAIGKFPMDRSTGFFRRVFSGADCLGGIAITSRRAGGRAGSVLRSSRRGLNLRGLPAARVRSAI